MFLKGRELDPLSPILARTIIAPYFFRRDYAHSLELLRQAKELRPSYVTFWEVSVYIQNKSFDEALDELEIEKSQRKDDVILLESLGKIYAAQGKRNEALTVIKELEAMSGVEKNQAQHIAAIYALLGDKENAFLWLDSGADVGAIGYFIKDDPSWDNIRNDPRFQDLLRRIGLAN